MSHSLWSTPYTIDPDHTLILQLGPLVLCVERTHLEWRTTYKHTDLNDPPQEPNISTNIPQDDTAQHPLVQNTLQNILPKRFGFPSTNSHLSLSPSLADRSVVVRPSDTIHLLPQHSMTLYVSTPLWVQLNIHNTTNTPTLLQEIPTWRPSDTWFGTPLEGELCYASTTQGRREIDDSLLRPHRAITTVHIRNLSIETLTVDRINIPVQHLSLYTSPSNSLLWTEDITLSHTSPLVPAQVELSKTPPEDTNTPALKPPRIPTTHTFAQRVFSSISSHLRD